MIELKIKDLSQDIPTYCLININKVLSINYLPQREKIVFFFGDEMPIEIDNKDLIDDMTVEDIYKRAKVILAKIR